MQCKKDTTAASRMSAGRSAYDIRTTTTTTYRYHGLFRDGMIRRTISNDR